MTKDDPKIGKHVLDLLTTGMYKEPCLIYREYIQNSADQIDELSPDERNDLNRCRIVIDIDRPAGRVTVRDSATGIPAKEFQARLLNVADSWKDPAKDKGFRGIGRLAGLAYCRKLVFETSAQGERTVSRMEMDGDEMRRILRDRKDRCSASELIKRISTITQADGDCPEWECYFKVTLDGIIEAVGGSLLDVDGVRSLIEQIAPVPFSTTNFNKWKQEIEKFAESVGHPLETYSITINGKTIVKPYKNRINDKNGHEIAKIEDVVFHRITAPDGHLWGWAWAAVPDQGRSIVESKNPERQLRLRKDNIQIGMADYFNGLDREGQAFFAEARANGYLLGEVHIIDPLIRPNADRNDLEVSEAAAKFLKKLRENLFTELWNAAREANTLTKARENIEKYRDALAEKKAKIEDGTLPFTGRREMAATLEAAFKKAADAISVLKKAKEKVHGVPDRTSPMELLRASKTEDLSDLVKCVVVPPKPVEPPAVPKPGKPSGGKKPGGKKASPPEADSKPRQPEPTLGDKIVKILIEKTGLDPVDALDVWLEIEKVLSSTAR